MRLHWHQHDVHALCPVCGVAGMKNAVVSTDHVIPGRPPVTLLACPACGAAFLEDRTPPDYEQDVAVMLDYYVEQGAGIDLLVAPLLRLPQGKIRRCLEIGCCAGFALDFGRFAFDWEVLGIDPSPLALAGAEALGFPVRRTYFSADLDLGPELFDLAICSEVLEHLAEPHALLAAIRGRLSADGILVLSTPNLAMVHPQAETAALGRALSPGFHMVLYSREALVRVLESAGFAAVRVEESSETLRVFAAVSPAGLDRLRPVDAAAERALLRDYFDARATSATPASAFACGFAYRHFKECVNAGLHSEATASRVRLARIYRERFGLDLETPDLEDGSPLPFNVTGALFFSGILELNGLGRPDRAAQYFAAAVAAGSLLQGRQNPFGLCDGETAELVAQSRKHLPMALAATQPDRAVREIEALENAPAGESLSPALLAEARTQTFSRLVDTGAFAAAERLAPPPPQSPPTARPRIARLFRRSSRRRPLLIAERFAAPTARLSGVVLPLDVIARQPAARLRFLVLADGGDYRAVTLADPRLAPEESLRLEFAPFHESPGALYSLGVLALSGDDATPVEADLRALRAAVTGRAPISLDCRDTGERTATGLLTGERGIAAFRVASTGQRGIRTAYWLDAFWCDAHGLYLQGWAHAHEHRVRALRIESAGRSARVDTFKDRPDLLVHYPEHEHVRCGGFTVYLACPPGHPVRLTLETDGGTVSVPLPLPEGPLPLWPEAPENLEVGHLDVVSPMLGRFVDLVNARGGRVLQVGARSPAGHAATPPRPLLRGPVIGLDIHPGHCVDLVGDAHSLGGFLRAGSFDAVVSGSVLEHLQAPWLFAAEVNRVLKPGGLVYHEAPGAWPAHAQPNDFWRMSAEGLRVLFGPDCGFEVLDAQDAGMAAMIPSPQWRQHHLAMPTVPTFAMAEILARKVADLPPGAVAWPLKAGASAERARLYPVEGLRVAPEPWGDRP